MSAREQLDRVIDGFMPRFPAVYFRPETLARIDAEPEIEEVPPLLMAS